MFILTIARHADTETAQRENGYHVKGENPQTRYY